MISGSDTGFAIITLPVCCVWVELPRQQLPLGGAGQHKVAVGWCVQQLYRMLLQLVGCCHVLGDECGCPGVKCCHLAKTACGPPIVRVG
jgi:hypothetical protein